MDRQLMDGHETFWCGDSSGQQSDRVSFSVQSDTTDKGVILEIPALPVRTGSDVILRCRQRNGATAAYFFIKGPRPKETKPEHIITKVQQSDEGLYSCSTDQGAKSSYNHPSSSSLSSSSSSFLQVPVVAGLVSGVLLVLVLGGVLFLCSKLKGGRGADLWSCGGDGCLRRSVCLCCLFLLTAAGVCVLLLFAPTVSAVSLSVSPNLQQVFSGSSVDLSCVDDGQTADGWTVRRTRGGLTEDCGAAAGFGRVLGSYCVVDLSAPSETFWCGDSSGQQSDRVSFSVQSDPTDKGVILEIPALPVRTGSDVILRCRQRNGATAAYFFINGSHHGLKPEHIITKFQHSDEGLYSCSTDQGGKSPESFLRVRDPPTVTHPPPHSPPPPSTSTNFPPPVKPPYTCPPSLLVPFVAVLVSGVLLVLVLVFFLCWKLKGSKNPSPLPVDVTYADVTINQRANRRDKQPADTRAVYSDVRTQTSEQSPDPCAVYSSETAGS
ncbi:uncharacterized protein LOC120435347 [Oreochromis aureus]|uniref:uncharacterized protein LOC120435347 n=1 Tax=Oreochromis aureus TaxID=47969 RepID=UPI0019541157|nr:uncharacterized protein LOC120435347 [Oreochromis aureus]